MNDKITIMFKDKEYEFNKGITLEKINRELASQPNSIVLANVNNEAKELTNQLHEDAMIDLIDVTTIEGQKTYKRSLSLLFIKATKDLFPNAKIELCHTISQGQYCEIHNFTDFKENHVLKIKERMLELVEQDIPFLCEQLPIEQAREVFLKTNRLTKLKLFENINADTVTIHSLGGYKDSYFGTLVPSTGYLNKFGIEYYDGGVILLCPKKSNPEVVQENVPQPKLIKIFKETKDWSKIHNIHFVADLNQSIVDGDYGQIIRICEALHEYKITKIAEQIYEKKKRIIAVAGPSSSGKTSFSKRLEILLMVKGLKPITIALDDYFVARDATPIGKDGKPDFESLYALDLELLNDNLSSLLRGEEVEVPIFNFKKGRREETGRILRVSENQPIIFEGIHGLNPMLLKNIDSEFIFKIFICPITQLNLDSHNRISASDCRKIRRMVRDNQHRNIDPKKTIQMWSSVKRGEEENIFPYQEQADAMFNSTLVYELAVLRKHALPLLKSISQENEEYAEAKRLLELLSYFVDIEDLRDIPPSSLLREFIGGSNIVH